jgi:hypothetical protein
MSLVTRPLTLSASRLAIDACGRGQDSDKDGDKVPLTAFVVAESFATDLRIAGHRVQNN